MFHLCPALNHVFNSTFLYMMCQQFLRRPNKCALYEDQSFCWHTCIHSPWLGYAIKSRFSWTTVFLVRFLTGPRLDTSQNMHIVQLFTSLLQYHLETRTVPCNIILNWNEQLTLVVGFGVACCSWLIFRLHQNGWSLGYVVRLHEDSCSGAIWHVNLLKRFRNSIDRQVACSWPMV